MTPGPSMNRTIRRAVSRALDALPVAGGRRYCPVCRESSRRFQRFGLHRRRDAQCPRCGALERHRLLWLYLEQRTKLFDGAARAVLHVAPEGCLEARLSRVVGSGYLTADLTNPAAVRMDIMDIQYPAESFDVVFCSHVLEHVPDDKKAMREFFRILKSDGWAILMVPITVERTVEDPSLADPVARERMFGQVDHLRAYGPDFPDRLREAGFAVSATGPADLVGPGDAVRMGLTEAAGKIFECTKGPSPRPSCMPESGPVGPHATSPWQCLRDQDREDR